MSSRSACRASWRRSLSASACPFRARRCRGSSAIRWWIRASSALRPAPVSAGRWRSSSDCRAISLLAMAFLFGIGSVFLVKLLSTVRGRTSMLTLVLAGVVISAFFSAAISIAKLLADPFQKLPAITYWLMGSIASSNYLDLLLVASRWCPSTVAIYLLRFQINIMSLGEEKARALGTQGRAGAVDHPRCFGAHFGGRGRDLRHHRLGRPRHPARRPRARRRRPPAAAAGIRRARARSIC